MEEIKRRQSVRGVLWAEVEQAILLIQIHFPDTGKTVWITPGGGINEGETRPAALAREVAEETGYRDAVSEGVLWYRSHEFQFGGKLICQDEAFHLVRVSLFDPQLQDDSDDYEKEQFQAWRWWTLEEIRTSDDLFSPRGLAAYLQKFLTDGVPENPPTVGL